MVLDECVLYPAGVEEIRRASERSLAWAKRSKTAHRLSQQLLFGLVQGGVDETLRRDNARALVDVGFDGYGIGGLAVGEPTELTREMTDVSTSVLPTEQPRYLMGSGTPLDLLGSVALGVDMFDCVMPTRNARNGTLFTSEGRLAIKNARYADDQGTLDPNCACYTCSTFSRGYLRHLFLAKESTAKTLNTIHNLHFYLDLMRRVRDAIEQDRFDELRRSLAHLDDPVA